ncbi:hypothetical protein BC829DRAFT_403509 [Chytridium lagenaria]|nr:hypothetical protein BC829DRAFT_403509 [Chytridium lagenaria]
MHFNLSFLLLLLTFLATFATALPGLGSGASSTYCSPTCRSTQSCVNGRCGMMCDASQGICVCAGGVCN